MSIKSLPDGYRVDIRPDGRKGKRIRKKFVTKSEAIQYERWVLSTQHNKPWADKPADRRSLTELIKLWWKHHGQLLKSSHNTLLKLQRIDRGMSFPRAHQITTRALSDYRTLRIEGGVKISTINREMDALRSLFASLIKSGHYCSENPLTDYFPLKAHAHEMGFLSQQECLSLLNHLPANEELAVKICLSTGARWGEVVKLTREHIRNKCILFINTKSNKNRAVPVAQSLYDEIKSRQGKRVFSELDYLTVRNTIKQVAPHIPKGQAVHVLRHTFASHFMMNGGNILALQKILGHSSIQYTMVYAHLAPDYLKDAVRFNPLSDYQ